MILVVGSTGYLGAEICRRLTVAGKDVRALVRATSDPEKVARLQSFGVQTVLGDLRDPASLAAACQGVETVISTANTVSTRQPGDSIPVTDQQGQLDLVQAARGAGVGHFILISIAREAAPCPLTTAKRSVEKAMIDSGMAYTILCAGMFMEVWLSPALGFDFPNGKVTIYGEGQAKNPYISLGDVAEYAAQSVDNPAARNQVLELSVQPELSMLETVQIFERASGKSYELQFVPAAALAAQVAAATDPLQASFATLMYSLAVGGKPFDGSSARQIFTFPLTSVEDYARQLIR